MAVATEAADRVMRRHNTSWKVGPPSHILYSASGLFSVMFVTVAEKIVDCLMNDIAFVIS